MYFTAVARIDGDVLALFLIMSVAAIVLHYMRRALADWAIRTLTEAGEGDDPLIKSYNRWTSPLLLIPFGIFSMVMGALNYGVETFVPWWLFVWAGVEAFVEGVDNLLRRLRW